jgi:hypothetical protein
MLPAAVRFDRGSPTLQISNASKVPHHQVRRVVSAIQEQVDRHFFPLWGWRAELVFDPERKTRRKGAMHIVLKNSNRDGEPGYHFSEGVPEAEVFTRSPGGRVLSDWDATLSHEVLEMVADPGVNLYALGHVQRAGRRRRAFVALEVCDPVQERLYLIGDVKVSDFVTPEWYEPERQRGSTKFSFLAAVEEPFELAEGGYVDAFVDGRFITVFGQAANREEKRYRRAIRQQAARLNASAAPASAFWGR